MVDRSPYRTAAEAADYLRVHPETIRRAARAGQLPASHIGNRLLFAQVDLDAFVHAQRPATNGARKARKATPTKRVRSLEAIPTPPRKAPRKAAKAATPRRRRAS